MNNQDYCVILCNYPGNPHHNTYEPIEPRQETLAQLLVRGTNKSRWVTEIPPSWISKELNSGVTLKTACAWHSMRRIVQFKEMCDYIASGHKYVFATVTRLQASLNPHLQLEHPQIAEWSAAHSSIGGYPLDRDLSPKHLAKLNQFAKEISKFDKSEDLKTYFDNHCQDLFLEESNHIYPYIASQWIYFGNREPNIADLTHVYSMQWSYNNKEKLKHDIIHWINNNTTYLYKYFEHLEKYNAHIEKRWSAISMSQSTPAFVEIWIKQQHQVTNEIASLLQVINNNFTSIVSKNNFYPNELVQIIILILKMENLRENSLDTSLDNSILERKWIKSEEFLSLCSIEPNFSKAIRAWQRVESLPDKIKLSVEFKTLSPMARTLFTFSPSQSTMPLNSVLAWEQSTALVLPHHEVNRGIDGHIEKVLRPFVIKLWKSIFLEQITSEQAVELFRIRVQAILIEIRKNANISKAKSDSLSSIDQMQTTSSSSEKKKTSPPEKARLKDSLTKVPSKIATSVYRALFTNPEGHSLVPKLDALVKSNVKINLHYWKEIRRELLDSFIDPKTSEAEKEKMLTTVTSAGLDITPCCRAVHIIAHFNALFLQNVTVYKSDIENSLRLMYTPTSDLDVDGAKKVLQFSGISVPRKCDESIFLVITDAMIEGLSRKFDHIINAPATPTLDIKICVFCRPYFSGLRSQGPSPLSIPEVDGDLNLP